MVRELLAAVRFELARSIDPRAILLAALCMALAIGSGYATLESHAALIQSAGEGASAQDVFIGMASSTLAVAGFLPMGVVVLTGSMVGRDNESGMRDVLLVRLAHPGAWWAGKVLATVAISLGYMTAVCLGSWLVDALVNGMPISPGPMPAWLTYPGGAAEAPAGIYAQMRPLPAEWNVYVFELVLVVLYGLLYAGFSLLCQAACTGSSSSWAPLVVALAVLATMRLVSMFQSLGFFYEALSWLTGVSLYRLPDARLAVSSYPLGEGLFADSLTMRLGMDPSVSVDLQLNSVASALALVFVLMACGVTLGAWRSRRRCTRLGPCGKE